MGQWAKSLFGQEKFAEIGIVVAGTNRPEFEKKILGFFDKVLSSKDSVYHAHLVEKKGVAYPVVFNVYGAPAMVDVLSEMHDGGCRIILFIGYAYGGFNNLEVGTVVVPDRSFHFDGIYHPIEPDRKVALPDKALQKKTEQILARSKVPFVKGTNVSVPAVTFQLPHANRAYQKIKPATLEMELAACFSRAKDLGMRAAGCLIISDNRKTSIGDEKKKKLRHDAKMKVLKAIIKNIASFRLPPLATQKEFSIDQHLASIIEDPKDVTNIYRKRRTVG